MVRGPLIPGLREYDAPRRRRAPAIWVWSLAGALVVVVLVVVGGIVAGIGPLRALGLVETPLTSVAWRETTDPEVIQVAVVLPDTGLCTGDEVVVRAIERATVVEVDAVRTAPRSSADCTATGIAGDRVWVDVALADPIGERTLVRIEDRVPLDREDPADAVVGPAAG